MKRNAVLEAVRLLKTIRADEHGKVEDSVASLLDEAIDLLESGNNPESAPSAFDYAAIAIEVLSILATVIEITMQNGK